jgi:hypothetical protein
MTIGLVKEIVIAPIIKDDTTVLVLLFMVLKGPGKLQARDMSRGIPRAIVFQLPVRYQ